MNLLAIAVSATLLAAAPGAPAPAAPAKAIPSPGHTAPPQGSHEDQELWLSVKDAHDRAVISRAEVSRLFWELRTQQFDERLHAQLQKNEKDPALKGAHDRLERAMNAGFAAGYEPAWPFDVRLICRQEQLDLAGVMPSPKGSKFEKDLPRARAAARECRDMLLGYVKPLEAAVKALDDATHECERVLPPLAVADAAVAQPGAPVPAKRVPAAADKPGVLPGPKK